MVEAIAIDDNNGGALGQIRDLVRTFEEEHGRQVRRVQTKQILDEGMKYYNEAHNGDDNDHKADNRKLAIERFTEALNLCQVGTLEPRYKKFKKGLDRKKIELETRSQCSVRVSLYKQFAETKMQKFCIF